MKNQKKWSKNQTKKKDFLAGFEQRSIPTKPMMVPRYALSISYLIGSLSCINDLRIGFYPEFSGFFVVFLGRIRSGTDSNKSKYRYRWSSVSSTKPISYFPNSIARSLLIIATVTYLRKYAATRL